MATAQSNAGSKQAIENVVSDLSKLVETVRGNIPTTQDPKVQALFETTAEVLLGLKRAYNDYSEGNEAAWK